VSISRWWKIAIVIAGIVVTQAILYGPSLLGLKIMLPLDLLAQPGVYLPRTPEIAKIVPHDFVVSDLIHQEMQRRFVHTEVSAGRLPLWQPFQYCGSPTIWPWFSPALVLAWSTASPVIWAWVHLFEALVAGLGAYVFFRSVLGIGFWPAAIAAWCYPMTGFFVFWQGNATSGAAFWLPWLLLAVDRVVQRPSGYTIAGLATATLLVLISGYLDVAGQCLLAAGLFGTWRIMRARRVPESGSTTRKLILALGAGWLLGFLLAAPYWLPVLEYSKTGARMARRAAGEEERPPIGISVLAQTVVPDMNGSTRAGSVWLGKGGSQIEGSAAAYAGLVATMLVAPLAWYSRRHSAFNVFASALIVLSLAWCLNLPLVVPLLRLPLLKMMSHNRLVFVGSFFVLCLAAIGLQVVSSGGVQRRKWFWIPGVLTAVLAGWCMYRMAALPEPLGAQLAVAVRTGGSLGWARTPDDAAKLQAWFVRAYGSAAFLSAIATLGWVWLLWGKRWTPALITFLGVAMIADMLWFAHGRSAQTDPALDFPRLEFFDALAKAPPGRILGSNCLPANLAHAVGLWDVRGYDGVDPARLVSLMDLAATPGVPRAKYAVTQWFQPLGNVELPGKLKLPPVLDLLGVRYVIFRGNPPAQVTPQLRSVDYWALVNPSALPRVFVPQRVHFEPSDELRLQKIGAADFDPRAVAFSEQQIEAPATCTGTAAIIAERPTRVSVTVQMETPGLVVLADRWDSGWAAYLDGRPVSILRVNHALRGVVVPTGHSVLEFKYEPESLFWGLRMAAMAVVAVISLLIWERRSGPRKAM
jgi:hypothetical protein